MTEAGTQAQLVLAKALPPHPHANLSDLQPALDTPGATLLPDVQSDPTTPVGKLGDHSCLDVSRHAKDKMTADTAAHRPRLDDHRCDSGQPIGYQHAPL